MNTVFSWFAFLCNLYSLFFLVSVLFVKFTKFSHHVHNLFIIGWYTLNTVKEEIRLPDNKAYKINFFFHNSPGAERCLGTPHFTGIFLSSHYCFDDKRIPLVRFSACGGSLCDIFHNRRSAILREFFKS